MQDIKIVEKTRTPEKISAKTNGEVMNWMAKHTSHIAPDRDHDQRYKDLYQVANRAGLKLYLKWIDWSDQEQFIPANHPMLWLLQPRLKGLDEREQEIQATMGTLCDENGVLMLDRLPILAELSDGRFGKVAGYKRSECLRRMGESSWAIVIKGADSDQLAKLARTSNKQTKDDVEGQSEDDHVEQYTTATQLWMGKKGIKDISPKSDEEKALKKHLKEVICEEQYKYCTDSKRLGVVISRILNNVYSADNKRYMKPSNVSLEDSNALDAYINEEIQKFIPHSIWDTSLNNKDDRGVFQFLSTAETVANTKQKLDTLLESNNRVYSGEQSLHMVEWIKFKTGRALAESVTKVLDQRLKDWTKTNNNPRRVEDYNIKPIERLFFPASFVGKKSRLFEWDKETRSFIEKLAVA